MIERRQLPRRAARALGALRRPALAARARGRRRRPGWTRGERNPFRTILVRSVELVFAADEALRLIAEYEPPDRPFVEVVPRAGVGYGCSEAPRGICWHRYEIDDDGTILDAKIVPPTSQNQKTIESDLRGVVERYADLPGRGALAALRAGDPQLRPVHLLRDALPEAGGRPRMNVIGIGNEWRGDDGVGLEVARRLGGRLLGGEPIGLVEALDGGRRGRGRRRGVLRARPRARCTTFDAGARAAARGALRRVVDARARARRGDRDRPVARAAARTRSRLGIEGAEVRVRQGAEPRGRGGARAVEELGCTRSI